MSTNDNGIVKDENKDISITQSQTLAEYVGFHQDKSHQNMVESTCHLQALGLLMIRRPVNITKRGEVLGNVLGDVDLACDLVQVQTNDLGQHA